MTGDMSDKLKTSPDKVKKFRAEHNLDQAQLDSLMGFSSGGRATRRWEAEGAPYYVTILIAYADKHGVALMEKLAEER